MNQKVAINTLFYFSVLVCCAFFIAEVGCANGRDKTLSGNEVVLFDGDSIKANTSNGIITIAAGKGLKRYYTWGGKTRSVNMIPRTKRWYGSMGLYYPGDGNHWKEHNRITRGVLEEGQQHFNSLAEATKWLKQFDDIVYNDNGLAVRYSQSIKPTLGPGSTLFVSVWQIYINGVKPSGIPGSNNKSIIVSVRE